MKPQALHPSTFCLDRDLTSFRGILEEPVEDLPQPVDQYLQRLQSSTKLAQEIAGQKDRQVRPIPG